MHIKQQETPSLTLKDWKEICHIFTGLVPAEQFANINPLILVATEKPETTLIQISQKDVETLRMLDASFDEKEILITKFKYFLSKASALLPVL